MLTTRKTAVAGAAIGVGALLVGLVLGTSQAQVVGQPRVVGAARPTAVSADKLKQMYHRPGTIPFPKENPYTPEKALLGKKLYFDTRLSSANLLSCASCHSPGYGWGDGQPVGVGHNMKPLGRRSPTIVNAAYGEIFMWDGRADSLEEQALGPIQADVEMNLPLDQLIARLKAIPEYAPLFKAAYGNETVGPAAIAKALATYERTVVSGRAPFDAWIEGDDNAISSSAKRGFALFNGKGDCAACHRGWNFTDDSFHDIGLRTDDIGRGKFVANVPKMKHAFKTPNLREIARRGPYMHNGSVPTLEAVVAHYNDGGVARPSRAERIKPLSLTRDEQQDLVAFMQTLTSNLDPTTIPVLPR